MDDAEDGNEVWAKLTDDPRFWVSSWGRVIGVLGRLLKPLPNTDGYLTVKLSGGKTTPIAPLVAKTFIGPRPEGHQVRHLDCNKVNNWVGNLAYGTPKENIADSIALGVHIEGSRVHCAKLTLEQVLDIRSRAKYYGLNQDLAREFGVRHDWISKLRKSERTWVSIRRGLV